MQLNELVPMEPGWIVQLFTGGPRMVINETYPKTDEVECVWFGEDNEAHSIRVNFNTLRVLDRSPGVIITATPD